MGALSLLAQTILQQERDSIIHIVFSSAVVVWSLVGHAAVVRYHTMPPSFRVVGVGLGHTERGRKQRTEKNSPSDFNKHIGPE